jgi:hypothetical protein
MQFALLIYAAESKGPLAPSMEQEETATPYRTYTQTLEEAGVYIGSLKLTDTTAATSVRVRDGKMLTIDGPYAETKEQLTGLYIVECDDMDEALERAAQMPAAKTGTIEVRPIESMKL